MRSKWFESHKYLVSLSMGVLISLRPLHAIDIASYEMLYFLIISSTIVTAWNIPAGSLLYASWSLVCHGYAQEASIWCLLYLVPSITSTNLPQFSLKEPSLTAIALPSQRSEDIYTSEVFMDAWVGLQRGLIDMGIWAIPKCCIPVDFTAFGIISSTFVGRLSSGGSWMGSSYGSMNIRWINFTCWHIRGR